MKRACSIAVLLVAVGVAVCSSVFAQMPGMGGMGMMRHSMVRHRYVMMNGIPASYKNLTNPLPAGEKNIQEGGKLYAANCASCHGEKGRGDGPAGAALDPPASHIASLVRMPMATDSYLFWTISEAEQSSRPPCLPSRTRSRQTTGGKSSCISGRGWRPRKLHGAKSVWGPMGLSA